MDPAGRHALVTGGGRGIGAAIAAVLSEAGARVTVLGRDHAALQRVMDSGAAEGVAVADVTDTDAMATALERAEAALGPVDILVNNAGAAESASWGRTDRVLWDRMLALNLTAVFETSQAVLPGMVKAGWGRVVNIASTAGLVGYPYVAAYAAAKHGVVGLTRALAQELARTGVTVNAVCPGFTETGLLTGSIERVMQATGRDEEAVRASLLAGNPQGRFVRPEEVAAAVLYLCGPHSAAMTGQALAVAGGEVP